MVYRMINPREINYRFNRILKVGKRVLKRLCDTGIFLLSLGTLCLLVYDFGFENTPEFKDSLAATYKILLQLFLYISIIRMIPAPVTFRKEKGFWLEIGILICLGIAVLNNHFTGHDMLSEKVSFIANYFLLASISLIHFLSRVISTLQRHLKPEAMFVYSFLFLILTGAFLLMLPQAHHGELDFINALFTSGSAVCITGLTVVNTSTAFTLAGQIIILALIQIGGIGVMTFTNFFAISFFSKVSFKEQMDLKGVLSENALSRVFRTLVYILLTTFIVESIGAVVIYQQISSIPSEQIPDKVFFSIFHSISAFCNAGFSTLDGNLYNPVVRNLYGMHLWIAILVIIGGIGFPIVFNFGRLFRYYFRKVIHRLKGSTLAFERKLHIVNLTTRIAIYSTLVLLITGTALFWIFENENTLKGLPFFEKFVTAFFGAVSPRTAGFNQIDMEHILPSTIYLTMILMWIGASPMSTGGGIKTTTFFVAILNVFSSIKNKERVEIAKRQITQTTVNRAHAIILLSLIWIALTTIGLTILEPQMSVTGALFEAISAFSTTGLILNQTQHFGEYSKILILVTMFAGRVGLFTILSGIVHQNNGQRYTYPDENVIL